jgi:hypothetical protein
MLFPGENRVTQQCSCFPFGCGHGDVSGPYRTLTDRRWTQFVQLEYLVRNADPSRLWRGLEQTAYIVKARQARSGVVCRLARLCDVMTKQFDTLLRCSKAVK